MHAPPLPRSLAALLLGFLLLAVPLAGCSSKSSGDAPVALPDTTVLVYMIGSDLESHSQYASKNISEMMEAGSTTGMNVVLQTGGANSPGTPPMDRHAMLPRGIDWTRTQRYYVHKGSLEQLEDLGTDTAGSDRDMGDAATLQAFLTWGIENYPARKYVVVLWDHGGGVNHGVGPDEVTGTALKVAGIRDALAAASQEAGQKFALVGFDTCLMGTAEVAASLAPSADFLVASQDLEPGPGWEYKSFLLYVADEPDAGGDAIGKQIVDVYVAKSTSRDVSYPVTLAVIDLSHAQALVDATNAFATALLPYAQTTDGWKQIAQARLRTLDWETSSIFGMATDLVDMSGFVTEVVARINANIGTDANLTQKGGAVTSAIEDAVVYSLATGSDERATGLTVYFPSVMWAFVNQDEPEKDRWTYATNTTYVSDPHAIPAVVSPYFASNYTDGSTGLVRKYYAHYLTNTAALQATVTLGAYRGEYLAARVSNEIEYALASQAATEPCKLHEGLKASAPYVLARCYQSMQVVREEPDASPGAYKVSLPELAAWPHIWDFPVVMVPDQVALNRAEKYDSYLVPVFLYDDAEAAYVPGFLRVEDTFAVPPLNRFKVLGFQGSAVRSAGKIMPIEGGQVFALGAYYPDTGEFLRTDRTIIASPQPVGIAIEQKRIGGGFFTYFVNDLTGTIQAPESPIDYAPVISSFTAEPATIVAGASTMLSWQVSGATSITIDPGGVPTGNPVSVSPVTDTTYTLTARNGNAPPVTARVTVTVTRPPPG